MTSKYVIPFVLILGAVLALSAWGVEWWRILAVSVVLLQAGRRLASGTQEETGDAS